MPTDAPSPPQTDDPVADPVFSPVFDLGPPVLPDPPALAGLGPEGRTPRTASPEAEMDRRADGPVAP